ncbi:MAG: cytochrome c biogenesis protein CcdA [Spirochaetes bacterium]|nr:cytochrome c biogenesis protein CcdA [Spirochaetota bacterium]
MEQLTILTAFTAGILSFLSPCVLPVIPGYISLITGLSSKELTDTSKKVNVKKITVINSLFFIFGFTLVFILLQVVIKGILFIIDQRVLNYIFGGIIIFFGLHTIGLFEIKFLYYQKSLKMDKKSFGIIGAFLVGIAFGFAWTPCIGPILAGILALASTQATLWKGVILLLVYSLGLGIPFLLTGIFMDYFLKFISRFKKYMAAVKIISGILLIIIGIYMLTGNFNKLGSIFL